MNKKELWKCLSAGKKLVDIMPVIPGDDCLITAVTGEEYDKCRNDDIVYIPDFDLNEIIYNKDISARPGEMLHVIEYCYTKQDFLNLCKGNKRMAYSLFCLCDWQNPNLDELLDCTDDKELKNLYGITLAEFDAKPYVVTDTCWTC